MLARQIEPAAARAARYSCALALFLCLLTTTGRAATKDSEAVGPSIDLDGFTVPISRTLTEAQGSFGASVLSPPGADVPLGGSNETTIAVNPTDPLNIASASLFELRVTTDGGTTWQPPVPMKVPTNFVVQGDPCLAFDGDGRLFWSYHASGLAEYLMGVGIDILVAQCDPSTGEILPNYPVTVTTQIGLPGSAGNRHDKAWLAVDAHPGSPFANRLYLVWTNFPPSNGNEVTLTSHSSDQGLTWSPALQLGAAGSGYFAWPAHIAVAPNGDVYVADHRQQDGNPGVSGFVNVFRSTDGGATFPQQTQAFTAGQADMTFNVQTAAAPIPGAKFWLQGSIQPWVLADPNVAGRIFVVSNDDPDNDRALGDAADVFIARSDDFGSSWSAPVRVDHGPGTTFQVMPTASIDPSSGAITVQFYDNRNGALNGQGDYLLDVFATVSLDGGSTFMPDFQVNDLPFDPEAGARCRFDCGPVITDVWAAGGGKAFAVTFGGDLLSYDSGVWSVAASTGILLNSVWGSSATDVFMCGQGGKIYHYDGVHLKSQMSGSAQDLFGMDGRTSGDVFVVGTSGEVLHSSGPNWSSLAPPTANELHDVWANPTGSAFITGRGGTVLRYNGAWTDLSIGSGEDLYGVWGSSDSDVYVAGEQGGLYHWNGSLWTPIDLRVSFLDGLWGSSASDIITVGYGGVQHYDGLGWSPDVASEHILYKLDGSGPSDVFAVGEDGEIEHFDGTGWTSQVNPLTPATPTRRIGEYNGIASFAGRSYVVWCGNAFDGGTPLSQQAIFDGFDTPGPTGVDLVDLTHPAERLALEPPRPNPAGRFVTAAYLLPRSATVDLSLLDVQGRRVATLLHGAQPAGRHVVSWQATRSLAAGVYLLRLTDGQETGMRRVTLLP